MEFFTIDAAGFCFRRNRKTEINQPRLRQFVFLEDVGINDRVLLFPQRDTAGGDDGERFFVVFNLIRPKEPDDETVFGRSAAAHAHDMTVDHEDFRRFQHVGVLLEQFLDSDAAHGFYFRLVYREEMFIQIGQVGNFKFANGLFIVWHLNHFHAAAFGSTTSEGLNTAVRGEALLVLDCSRVAEV